MHTALRRFVYAALVSALAVGMLAPATAQLPPFQDLPLPDPGAIGPVLDPVEDLIGEISGAIDDALSDPDLPLDNAIRLTGGDAVGAALALSQATFETAETVLLARDDVFADTLSSVAAQGIAGAPLLLTQTATLDQRVIDELTRLQASRVIVLGNFSAISEAVEAEVAALGYDTSRAGGPTRIETAAAIAGLIAPQADTALLLRAYPDAGADQAQAYADALAVGPLGSLKEWPVLLTTTNEPHQATMDYLAASSVQRVIVVGGDAAVSPIVSDAIASLGVTVDRIAGPNRFATAIAIANELGYSNAADPSRLILSEAGDDALPLWSAGFAAAAHGAVYDAPVLLADGPILPVETITFIADGLLENALRVGNEPLICNSFVDLVACESAALLMVGLLDEADALLGGQLSAALGSVYSVLEQVLVAVEPVDGGATRGLVDELLALLGLPATGEDDDADDEGGSFAAVPNPLGAALADFAGTDGSAARSGTEQAILLDAVAALRQLLDGATIDVEDAEQNAALAEALSGLTVLLDDEATELPLDALEDVLTSLEDVLGVLLDADGIADVLEGVGADAPAAPGEVVDTVAGLLKQGGNSQVLVERYGSQAQGLAASVDRVRVRGAVDQ